MIHNRCILSFLLLSHWIVPCLSEWRGNDFSMLPDVEAAGGVYYNGKGQEQDAVDIFADSGINMARIHIFNNPTGKCCDTQEALHLAHRLKARGVDIVIDWHFLDTWAGAGMQARPAEWKGLNFDQLTWALRQYTKKTLQQFYDDGIDPVGVQLGNEVRV